MTDKKGGLNGSANLLAQAMQKAFADAVENGVKPMEQRLNKRIDGVEDKLSKEIAEVRGEVAYARKQGELTGN